MCSENKGADQLCGYRKADLRHCFRICKSQFSHDEAHINVKCKQLLIRLEYDQHLCLTKVKNEQQH